jgi:hypothetical protein
MRLTIIALLQVTELYPFLTSQFPVTFLLSQAAVAAVVLTMAVMVLARAVELVDIKLQLKL